MKGHCYEIYPHHQSTNGRLGTFLNFLNLILSLNKHKGGLITITGDHFDEVSAAVVNFQGNVTDKKAAILPTYNSVLGTVCELFLC
jgi:hypothetical protein